MNDFERALLAMAAFLLTVTLVPYFVPSWFN